MSHATAINTMYLSEHIEVKCANLQQKANIPQSWKAVTRTTTEGQTKMWINKCGLSTVQHNKDKIINTTGSTGYSKLIHYHEIQDW